LLPLAIRHHNRHHRHISVASVIVVMMVTITRIVMVAERGICPGERGPSWRYSNAGGDSAALRHRLSTKQGLQGLQFAPGMPVGCRDAAPVLAFLAI